MNRYNRLPVDENYCHTLPDGSCIGGRGAGYPSCLHERHELQQRDDRRVVCAANRSGSFLVLAPRHWDPVMRMTAENINNLSNPYDREWEQGFIDQWGIWMDRREAWRVAAAAGQILYRCGGDATDGGTLYSENLY